MTRLTRWLLLVAWSAVILAAADDSFSAKQSGGWFRELFGRELPYALHVAVRKCAHLFEYAVLGALAWNAAVSAAERAASRRGAGTAPGQPARTPAFLFAMSWALVIALLDEWRQSLSPMRTGSGWDVLLDLAGAAIGIMFVPAVGALPSWRARAD